MCIIVCTYTYHWVELKGERKEWIIWKRKENNKTITNYYRRILTYSKSSLNTVRGARPIIKRSHFETIQYSNWETRNSNRKCCIIWSIESGEGGGGRGGGPVLYCVITNGISVVVVTDDRHLKEWQGEREIKNGKSRWKRKKGHQMWTSSLFE